MNALLQKAVDHGFKLFFLGRVHHVGYILCGSACDWWEATNRGYKFYRISAASVSAVKVAESFLYSAK